MSSPTSCPVDDETIKALIARIERSDSQKSFSELTLAPYIEALLKLFLAHYSDPYVQFLSLVLSVWAENDSRMHSRPMMAEELAIVVKSVTDEKGKPKVKMSLEHAGVRGADDAHIIFDGESKDTYNEAVDAWLNKATMLGLEFAQNLNANSMPGGA